MYIHFENVGDEDEVKEVKKEKKAEFKNKFGYRLKEIRRDRANIYANNNENPLYEKYNCCLTQENFAKKINVNRRTVIKWENGEAYPTIDNFVEICDLLDCNMNYFLGVDDEIPENGIVSLVYHYTNIKQEIIKLAMTNSDYLNCLNFFMSPENCESLYNITILTAWKKSLLNDELSKIKNPLQEIVFKAFETFYLCSHTDNLTPDLFKEYLKQYLPESILNFDQSRSKKNILNIKNCFVIPLYLDFKRNLPAGNHYEYFIDFICSYFFTSLVNNISVDLYKNKISERFITVLKEYLKNI